ncbi:MAG: exodeoxyribonuclease VII large subunit [Proteobacteria bacterium]|nr:exodeoxyribonuclease VII large subunit [Pseudomonadota bacterium]
MNKEINIFTVSELTSIVKDVLENAFPSIWVRGEISNLKNYGNHLFFTLKDERSQIRAVLFRGYFNSLKFNPKDGMSVIVRGTLSLYQARGEFQLIANYMEPLGIGLLKLAYEELKEKLSKKGYFDEDRKKKIPFLPQKIAIITSPKGAVIKDILNILRRRYYNLHIIIIPVKVQGEGAREEIADAIRFVNEKFADYIEVIILARGGGSLEDLWAFNEEIVADAIYKSRIPIISAIGHETDFTIADFVADLRAPTPSAAAELVVQKKEDIEKIIRINYRRLKYLARKHILLLKKRLISEERALKSPIINMKMRILRAYEIRERFILAFKNQLDKKKKKLLGFEKNLSLLSPIRLLKVNKEKIFTYHSKILKSFEKILMIRKEKVAVFAGKIDVLSPLKVLSKGYSITFDLKSNKVIKDASLVEIGDSVKIKLFKGILVGEVKGKE